MHGKGEFSKLKGLPCNVPVESDDVSKVLPRGADSNGITRVKVKRDLKYKEHVLFEPVKPNILVRFLQYLRKNNHLYQDITIST